ncbi:DUF736 domain-containing protein [Phenylobacterium sp.]|uniref:DUF736 domain-containing protein n=1 Tax=Phenylobacterium sp. TaxID=1871053 RepID=UPI0035B14270
MTIIGVFSKTTEGKYQGALRTLTLNVKGVEIRPVERSGDRAPDHRIYLGQTVIGAAWTVTREGKPSCLSVQVDDPSLPAPIHALLVDTGGSHELLWSRKA